MTKGNKRFSATMDNPEFSESTQSSAPRGLLHFYTLLSIDRKPMRGYDLMKEIELKTEGAWRPGAGTVYPVLQKLVKQNYIKVKARANGNPPQVMYEITPTGRESIANSRKMMRSSGERWNLMRQLFIDLMEPDDLVKFVLNSMGMHTDLVHTLVDSKKSALGWQDKLYVLHQYKLNLERELVRANQSIKEMNRPTRQERRGRRP